MSYGFRRNPYGYKTIGKVGEISLGEARKIAAQWKMQLGAGQNPVEKMKRKKREMQVSADHRKPTLTEAWLQYKTGILVTKSESHRTNMARSMEKHFLADFGKRAPDEVYRREFIAFREKHEVPREKGGRLAEMRQMKAYISAFYKWMAETSAYMDYVDGLPNLGKINATANIRTGKLTDEDDIRSYWQALDTVTPRATALALRLKFFSNKRGIEVRRLTPDQIDFRREVWSLPDVRNEANKVQHPLTPTMLSLIREALGNRNTGYVFSTTGGEKMVAFSSKITKNGMLSPVEFERQQKTITEGV